jgi:hypothetical protein
LVDSKLRAAFQAADTTLPRCDINSRRISTADIAGLNRYPCISVQPRM